MGMGGATGKGGGGGTGLGGTGVGFGGVGVGAGATMESLTTDGVLDGASWSVSAGSRPNKAEHSSSSPTPTAMAKRRPSAGGFSQGEFIVSIISIDAVFAVDLSCLGLVTHQGPACAGP